MISYTDLGGNWGQLRPADLLAFSHTHSVEDLYIRCAVVCGGLIHLAAIAGGAYLLFEHHATAATFLLSYEVLLVISGFQRAHYPDESPHL